MSNQIKELTFSELQTLPKHNPIVQMLSEIKLNEMVINKRLNLVAVEPADVDMLNRSRENMQILTKLITLLSEKD